MSRYRFYTFLFYFKTRESSEQNNPLLNTKCQKGHQNQKILPIYYEKISQRYGCLVVYDIKFDYLVPKMTTLNRKKKRTWVCLQINNIRVSTNT